MRFKKFTLMVVALLVSMTTFAQLNKAISPNKVATRSEVKAYSMKAAADFSKAGKTAVVGKQLAKAAKSRRAEAVVPPADADLFYYDLAGTHSRAKGLMERTVPVYITESGDVYVAGFSYFLPDAFVKGTFDEGGTTVVFPKNQYYGSYSFSDGAADLYFSPEADITATFDTENNVFTITSDIDENYVLGESSGLTAYWGYQSSTVERQNTTLTYNPNPILPVTPPAGLVTEDYAYTGTVAFSSGGEVSRTVKLGFDGNIAYLQGISEDLPEAWIKGSKDEGGNITFPSIQLLGSYSASSDLYFRAASSGSFVDELTLAYDSEAQAYTTSNEVYICNQNNGGYEYVKNVKIAKIVEKAATPANPAFNNMQFNPKDDKIELVINVADTDGKGMVADKLYYKLFYKDELGSENALTLSKDLYTELEADLTEIPYTFTSDNISNTVVTLLMEHADWTAIGLQSVYKGGGETHESEKVWYTIKWPFTVTKPSGLAIKTHTFEGTSAEEEFSSTLNICTNGDDIYIQGLAAEAGLDAAWIKGTKNAEGGYTFASGQDLGATSSYRVFFIGIDSEDKVTDATMSLVSANNVYKFNENFIINVRYTDRSYYYTHWDAGCTISVEGTGYEPVTPPTDLEVKAGFMPHYLNTGSAKVTMNNIKFGVSGTDVYVQGVYQGMPNAWVKGTLDTAAGTVTFQPQYLGMDADDVMYFFVGTTTGSDAVAMTFSYQTTEEGSIVMMLQNPTFFSVSTSISAGTTSYLGDYVAFHNLSTITAPDGMTSTMYTYNYESYDGSTKTYSAASKNIRLGISGDKAYIQGLSSDYPDAWVKGTVSGSTITFNTPQAFTNDGEAVMLAYDRTNNVFLNAVQFNYDATTGIINQGDDIEIFVNSQLLNRSYYYEVMRHGQSAAFAEEVVTPPAGAVEGKMYMEAQSSVKDDKGAYTYYRATVTTAQVDGSSDIYLKGLFKEMPDAWVKGTISDKTITIASGQYLGLNGSTTAYFVAMSDNVTLTATTDIFRTSGSAGYIILSSTKSTDGVSYYYRATALTSTLKVGSEPTGLTQEDYKVTGNKVTSTGLTAFEKDIKVAFDDANNRVYVQGLYATSTGAGFNQWAIGVKSGDSYVFPTQCLGNYYYYLMAYSDEVGLSDQLTFTYDATAKTLTATGMYVVNTNLATPYYYLKASDVVLAPSSTGIQNINADDAAGQGAWYNMNGVKVEKPVQKGLYIHNGKKMVIK